MKRKLSFLDGGGRRGEIELGNLTEVLKSAGVNKIALNFIFTRTDKQDPTIGNCTHILS